MTDRVINSLKIHLIKTPEFNSEKYLDVCYFLQSFEGPMEFIEDVNFTEEQAQIKDSYTHNDSYEYYKKMGANFGDDGSLFNFCALYRQENGFNNNDGIVVLLTNHRGSENIPSIYDSHNNIVIAVAEWDKYPEVDDLNPITHLIIKTIFQSISNSPDGPIEIDTTHEVEGTRKTITSHEVPTGCINDLTENHFRVLLKLNNTEFCDSCESTMVAHKINYRILNQGEAIFEAIAKLNRRKSKSPRLRKKREYSNILLFNKRRIVFTGFNEDLHLPPIQKALYVFFLINCPTSGITLSELRGKVDSIRKIYELLNTEDITEKELAIRIEKLAHNHNDSFVINRSAIKRRLINQLGRERVEDYLISGDPTMNLGVKISKKSIRTNDKDILALSSFPEIQYYDR